jgi:hypothetical protein
MSSTPVRARAALLSPTVSATDEDAFFARLRLPNGTYKTTGHRRMVDVDRWLLEKLPPAPMMRVLDVAVSSGATTADLVEAFGAAHQPLQLTACDLCVRAYLRSSVIGTDLLIDPKGKVLQLATPWFVRGRPHDPAGSLARRLLASVIRAVEAGVGGETRVPADGDAEVFLVSRRLRDIKDVQILEHDLSVRHPDWSERFDFVRAANILHRDYFSDATLVAMVNHLMSYVPVGGHFLIVRTTDEGASSGTLFSVDTKKIPTVAARFAGGSDIEALVLSAGGATT